MNVLSMACVAQSSYATPKFVESGQILRGSTDAPSSAMTPEELRKRTKTFALNILRFCRALPRTDEATTIKWQLQRSGTSVGANYRAVCRHRSDRDFIAKLGLVIEEADESGFWLELLVDAEIVPVKRAEALLREADELTRIFVASRETVRRRVRARKKARIVNH